MFGLGLHRLHRQTVHRFGSTAQNPRIVRSKGNPSLKTSAAVCPISRGYRKVVGPVFSDADLDCLRATDKIGDQDILFISLLMIGILAVYLFAAYIIIAVL